MRNMHADAIERITLMRELAIAVAAILAWLAFRPLLGNGS
jgi:hypothetical protein